MSANGASKPEAHPPVIDALRTHRADQEREALGASEHWSNLYDLVFTTSTRRPIDPNNLRRDFRGQTIARFASRAHCASYNATAPIEASSGNKQRHRLNPKGNRQLNWAIHMIAVTQLRNPGTQGRIYFDRNVADGKTNKEAMRALKRRISDVVYRHLVADAEQVRHA